LRPAAAAETIGRWLLAVFAALWLAMAAPGAQAQPAVELSQLSTAKADEGLELSFATQFELPRAVDEALHKGVPIYFVAEATLLRSRWYWRDARVARATISWRLTWQPLTRQYRVSTGGLHRSYAGLNEALASVQGISGWRVAEGRDIDEDARHYLEFSYRLDTSQLPRPMQIGLGSPQGWALAVERTLQLNTADYTSQIKP
jgi:hypothetical protein